MITPYRNHLFIILEQTLNGISPECVVRDYLAPLLSPALTLANHSTTSTTIMHPSSSIINTSNQEEQESFQEATGKIKIDRTNLN